jgi:peptidoglycan hydrolase-like protein with peptidoglycan-binding domain
MRNVEGPVSWQADHPPFALMTRPNSPRRTSAANAQASSAGFFSGPWMPALAAGCVLVVVVATGMIGSRSGDSAGNATTSVPTSTFDTTTTLAAAPDTSPVPAVAKTAFASPLAMGAAGDDVVQLQQRLTDLGFQPGPVDGQFGSGTQQAVWAYKKLVGNIEWEAFSQLADQTVVTNELWQAMQEPSVQIIPRRPNTGKHVEIYLPLQVLALFDENDTPIFVSHISTGELNPDGSDATFCEEATYTTDIRGNALEEPETKQICAESKTPPGVFRFKRYEDGQHVSPLGGMKNPWYFNYGIAIHGAQNVPTYPASHGCVRMSNSLADVFPTLVEKGNAVYVWGYDGREPEGYTEKESLPSFNRPDPNATTTTTTTTTTVPPTTVAPSTTQAPVTTPAPATTSAPTTAAPITAAPTTAAPSP